MKKVTSMHHDDGHDTKLGLRMAPDQVEKLRALRDTLAQGLVERDIAVRLGLLAALAGEHMLMLGPPGTAKSAVARRLHLAVNNASYFERLLTRFTVPEELFGPLSIKGLEEDRYERLTAGYLPTASVAFLDEIFKANSAILNALLTLLNEREFDNGTVRSRTPLVAVIGASNELPEGDELDALFDRFLVRLHVGPVSKDAFPTVLGLRGDATPDVPPELRMTSDELQALRKKAEAVDVPADVVTLLCELRDWCTAQEISVSDRRWRKVLKLLQVSAATNGRDSVSIWDCWLLQHCLWDTPEAREKVFAWYSNRVGASAAMVPARLTLIVAAWEARLKKDQSGKSQMCDSDGHLLFEGPDGKRTRETTRRIQKKRGVEPLFLAPRDARIPRGTDHTNGGNGFTREELNGFLVPPSPKDAYFGWVSFGQWSGRADYLDDQDNWLAETVDLPPALEPTRHSVAHIRDCMAELDGLLAGVEGYREKLMAHIATLEAEIRQHLWVTPDFARPAAQHLEETRRTVEALLARVAKLREGFQRLPQEPASVTSERDPGPVVATNAMGVKVNDFRRGRT